MQGKTIQYNTLQCNRIKYNITPNGPAHFDYRRRNRSGMQQWRLLGISLSEPLLFGSAYECMYLVMYLRMYVCVYEVDKQNTERTINGENEGILIYCDFSRLQ